MITKEDQSKFFVRVLRYFEVDDDNFDESMPIIVETLLTAAVTCTLPMLEGLPVTTRKEEIDKLSKQFRDALIKESNRGKSFRNIIQE